MKARVSWLDFKLGFRMLVKYPGLTMVGGLAVALAVALGVAVFEFATDMFTPQIPLEDSHEIVTLRNRDLETAEQERRSLHDFFVWREEVESIDHLGAAHRVQTMLSTEDGTSASVRGAAISPSAFRLTRVPPLMGRSLVTEDELPSSPPVVVIGYDVWQRVFGGDASVLGRTVRMASATATVVGVMPQGYAFPVNQEVWTPLRADALTYERRQGPSVVLFGRLASGYTLEQAQAELTAIGQRMAATYPDTHAQLRPSVVRLERALGEDLLGGGLLAVSAMNLPFLLVMLVICANVATLVFARTATRETELALRTALGASRKRLMFQLFAEALVLTGLAAVLGVGLASCGLRWGMDVFWEVQQSRPPFWFDPGLKSSTVAYVALLALFGAAVIGGIPALKATGRRGDPGLGRLAPGTARLKFGLVSTGVIVVQVALCVVFLPIFFWRGQEALGDSPGSAAFPAGQYLTGRISLQADVPPDGLPEAARTELTGRAAELFAEARRRLAEEPGVADIAFASRIGGMNHPGENVRVEGRLVEQDSADDVWLRTLAVDPDFFETMRARILAGRGFGPTDAASDVRVVVVDEWFVDEVMEGRNPVGQRLRYPDRRDGEGEVWHQIVGVARANHAFGPAENVGVYAPLRPDEAIGVQVFLRTDTPPEPLAPQVHSIVTSLDPDLTVEDLLPLSEVWRPVHEANRFFTWVLVTLSVIALGLSMAGIYALMSFTVAQRTREIGIRAALGAHPGRILATVFSRALAQITLGVVAGGTLLWLTGMVESAAELKLVLAVAALMMVAGVLASAIPIRRALGIEPTEALRAEA